MELTEAQKDVKIAVLLQENATLREQLLDHKILAQTPASEEVADDDAR